MPDKYRITTEDGIYEITVGDDAETTTQTPTTRLGKDVIREAAGNAVGILTHPVTAATLAGLVSGGMLAPAAAGAAMSVGRDVYNRESPTTTALDAAGYGALGAAPGAISALGSAGLRALATATPKVGAALMVAEHLPYVGRAVRLGRQAYELLGMGGATAEEAAAAERAASAAAKATATKAAGTTTVMDAGPVSLDMAKQAAAANTEKWLAQQTGRASAESRAVPRLVKTAKIPEVLHDALEYVRSSVTAPTTTATKAATEAWETTGANIEKDFAQMMAEKGAMTDAQAKQALLESVSKRLASATNPTTRKNLSMLIQKLGGA